MKLIWKSSTKDKLPSFIDGIVRNEVDSQELVAVFLDKECSVKLAETHADCLNAAIEKKELIIWMSNDLERLKKISPIDHDYGWVLASINVPIYIKVNKLLSADDLKGLQFDGFYSEDLDILAKISERKK